MNAILLGERGDGKGGGEGGGENSLPGHVKVQT